VGMVFGQGELSEFVVIGSIDCIMSWPASARLKTFFIPGQPCMSKHLFQCILGIPSEFRASTSEILFVSVEKSRAAQSTHVQRCFITCIALEDIHSAQSLAWRSLFIDLSGGLQDHG
jgi:hypothetical protein